MKKILVVAGRFLLLVVLYMAVTMISGMIAGTGRLFTFTKEEQMAAASGALVVAAFFAGVLFYIASRSAWRGIKLIAAVFCAYFGIAVFLTQIESLVFLKQLVKILPEGAWPVLVLDNTIASLLFSPLVVLVSGKIKGAEEAHDKERLKMPAVEWAVKFPLLGLAYYGIYIFFGSFVMVPMAGQEAFAAYYKDLQMPAWMPVFQVCRGMIWTAIAVPVILMFKGGKIETGFAVALLFSVLMGINLIVPLPFMPEKIRMAHLAEVLSSNFVFGCLAVFVLTLKILKQKTA